MSLRCLRDDLPEAYAFSVTELPHHVKLDQNESPVDLPEELKREITGELAAQPWHRYIQPEMYTEAKRGICDVLDLDPDTLVITAGADQALEAAFMVGGGPGRTARWFEPTYPYVANAARRTYTERDPVVLGAEIDALIDEAAIDAEPRCDLVALVSPNNPTGGPVSDAAIDAALADRSRLVVVDEAYYDFSRQTVAHRVPADENLLVVRSLSKSSIAGVHLGFTVAHPDAVRAIERLYTAPYHLNALFLLVARRYPDIHPHVLATANRVIAERQRVWDALAAIDGITPRPSRTNFILFEVAGDGRARALHRQLAEAGIRVRDVGGLAGLTGFLRVTIGTAEENDMFLQTITAG